MKKEKRASILNPSIPKFTCLLLLLCIVILTIFAGIFILSHRYELPIEYEELPILLSILGGLLGTGISGVAVLYITKAQLSHQKSFFMEQKSLESDRFFFQFYLTEIGKFEELHRKWIQNSDYFMKYAPTLSPTELKVQFRELRDPLVLLERFHSIFISEEYMELWNDFSKIFNAFHNWLIEKNEILLKKDEVSNLPEEYFHSYYKSINGILAEITDKLIAERKCLVIKMRSIGTEK